MATAKVDIGSDLKRKSWVNKGLIQKAHKSFWSPMTGSTKESVVFQSKDKKSKSGHDVIFDFDGNLSGKPIKGRNVATGKGEQKKKFSNKLTVDRYRLVVDNGDKFDGVDIGDLSINQHASSRSSLGDLFYRFKDQMLFDSVQGSTGQTPTHIIDIAEGGFGYNSLIDIEGIVKTSSGFSTGGIRRPLSAYTTKDGKSCWLFVVDSAMALALRKDPLYQTIVYNADVRGKNNLLFKGVFGKMGNLILVEADKFFGDTEGAGSIGFDDTGIEIAGLRQKDGNGLWTGQEGFDATGDLYSRGSVLGAGALQLAFGKQPDYIFQKSSDFGITTESAVEFWTHAQKTKLKAENGDYSQAKVTGIDFGVINVDVKVQ